MKKILLRKKVINEFRRTCSRCEETCCKKQKAFSIFDSEMLLLPAGMPLKVEPDWGSSCGVSHFTLAGSCPYSNDELKGCELDATNRPLDCMCYPFYPRLKEDNGALSIDGLIVHKSCGHWEQFSRNKKLPGLLKEVFEEELLSRPAKSVLFWLKPGHRYWDARKVKSLDL